MPRAIWKGKVIADSSDTVVVEGNHYFPLDSINQDYLQPSSTHSICPWKGEAGYYDIVVEGESAPNSAWQYPEPKDAAAEIRDHVAFHAPPVIVTN